MTKPLVHRSKIDAWLLAVLLVAMGASLWAAFAVLTRSPPQQWWSAALSLGAGFALPLWLLCGTRYTLEPQRLRVHSGPFRWQVPLAEITAITPTSNPLSSPALSLDRLRIDYGRGKMLMISPQDKDRFLRDIEALRRETR